MFHTDTKILVVDDMETMRMLLVEFLKELGYTNVVEADSGESAWNEITHANPPFGLMITDWNMPKLSGLDLVKRIKSDARYKNLPMILATTESETPMVIQAVRAGVHDYMVKPFKFDMFRSKLEGVYKKLYPTAPH